MMEFKDYYKILGVERTATAEDVKHAYRKLARKYHPDVSKEAGAEARFKEIGEAYHVLQDPEKRAAYDQLGDRWRPGQEFTPPPDWSVRALSSRVAPYPRRKLSNSAISFPPCSVTSVAPSDLHAPAARIIMPRPHRNRGCRYRDNSRVHPAHSAPGRERSRRVA
jgi:curved DNA-binding protein CbpA